MEFVTEFIGNVLYLLSFVVLFLLVCGLVLGGWIGVHLPFVSRTKYDADLAAKEHRATTAEKALRQLDRWYADAAARNTMLLEELAATREANQTLILSMLESKKAVVDHG